jgi:hypothetical protein
MSAITSIAASRPDGVGTARVWAAVCVDPAGPDDLPLEPAETTTQMRTAATAQRIADRIAAGWQVVL